MGSRLAERKNVGEGVMRRPVLKATELPPEERFVGGFNAYEIGRDAVRVAVQLSDADFETNQLALMRIAMAEAALAEVEYVVDEMFAAFSESADHHVVLVESGNVIHRQADGIWTREVLDADFLRDAYIRALADAYVFGNSGEIFAWREGAWRVEVTPADEPILAMDGESAFELYAVGGNGVVLRRRERDWERIDTGVGVDFRGVRVVGTDVYIAGERGIAGCLRGSEFLQFETDLVSDFLSVCEHRGAVYFSDSSFGVTRLRGTALEPVAGLGYVYRLQSGREWMTATAGKFVYQYDGTAWRGVEVRYDDGYRTILADVPV